MYIRMSHRLEAAMATPLAWPDPEVEVGSTIRQLWLVYNVGHVIIYFRQSQNRILRAAASGDVAALRRLARETDPVLVAAVENRV